MAAAAPDGLEAVPAQRTGAWGDQAELDAAIESRTITSVHIKVRGQGRGGVGGGGRGGE